MQSSDIERQFLFHDSKIYATRHPRTMGCSPHVGLGKVPIQKINEAYDHLVKGDVKYRFVIDMKSLG
jgi:hypothetical protein